MTTHTTPDHDPTRAPTRDHVNAYGQPLCTATTRDGRMCNGIAMQGQTKCRMHGGSSPQAKNAARLRLFDLVDPAITRLARLMSTTDDEKVMLQAINTILDRTGYQRGYEVTLEDARAALAERLERAQHDQQEKGDTDDDE